MNRPLEITDPGLPTRVLVGAGMLADPKVVRPLFAGGPAFIVAPPSVEGTHLRVLRDTLDRAGVRHAVAVCDDGEPAKRLDAAVDLYRAFADLDLTRDSLVVALGGGSLTDLVGFAAGTWLRGLRYAAIPTTLVGQADAAIGGKCGVNFDGLKNRVGMVYHPEWVLADTETLLTLPEEHFRNGLPELAKAALLESDEAVDALLAGEGDLLARDPAALARLVAGAVDLKLRYAGADPADREGIRAALNLGHTLGHALEAVSEFRLSHGEGVAAGLLFALHLSAKRGEHPRFAPLAALFGRLGLLGGLARLGETESLVDAMARDKKRDGDAVRFVTLPEPGRPGVRSMTPAALADALAGFFGRLAGRSR